MMTMSPEKIAELRKLRGCGLISAVGEYTPDELWEAFDEIERLRAAALGVIAHMDGRMPVRGWLKDTDTSREALAELVRVLGA